MRCSNSNTSSLPKQYYLDDLIIDRKLKQGVENVKHKRIRDLFWDISTVSER